MNILMTNLRLTWYSGSDTYLYTLGKELIKRGHNITIYAPVISSILQGRRFADAGFDIVSDISKDFSKLDKYQDFDVIHGQHNAPVSKAHNILSKIPVIFVSHGVLPLPEKYPRDVLISKYIAVSEEVLNYQYKNISDKYREIIRNPIDTERFYYAPNKLGKKIKILVSSNYYHNKWEADEIWEAAKILNAEVDVIGTNGKMTFETEELIRKCDIGIGLGRSILEIMAMGKPAIIGDYNGYDGVITPESYSQIKRKNFSSRTYAKKWDGKKLAEEIKKIFSNDYTKIGKDNRDIILKHHNLKTITDRFEQIYKQIIK